MTTPDRYQAENKVRFVTAASLFDGHDAAINIMRRILQAQGAEVIHLGHNRSVKEIVDAAVQEDAQGIAVSSYQGGHIEFFKYMIVLLKERGAEHIKVYGNAHFCRDRHIRNDRIAYSAQRHQQSKAVRARQIDGTCERPHHRIGLATQYRTVAPLNTDRKMNDFTARDRHEGQRAEMGRATRSGVRDLVTIRVGLAVRQKLIKIRPVRSRTDREHHGLIFDPANMIH